jgi:vacuole morphology and inheritance protein 14
VIDEQIQLTAIKWVNEFIQVVPHVVIPATPNLIKAMLPCLTSQNGDIRQVE